MKQKIERRFLSKELRVSKEGRALEGHAAVFDSQSVNLGWFREVIRKGAFSRALREQQDVRGLVNHDPNKVLGRTKSATLTLREDDKGLAFRIDLGEQSYANDLYEAVKRGDMDQCSFGFSVPPGGDRWTNTAESPEYVLDEDEESGRTCMIRELHDVDLADISVVTYPAYEATSAAARSLELRALWPEGLPDGVEQRRETREKTKKVSGVDVPMSKFAYVGDPDDTSTWKLPIHDKSHVQNALARFGQTKGIPASEKKKVYNKILAAAKKFGIHVSEENSRKFFDATSAKDGRAILRTMDVRAMDPDGDGDDDEPLIDCLDEAIEGCHDVARLGSAAHSEVMNGDVTSKDPSLEEFIEAARELVTTLQDAIKEAEDEVGESDGEDEDEEGERMRLRLRVAEQV